MASARIVKRALRVAWLVATAGCQACGGPTPGPEPTGVDAWSAPPEAPPAASDDDGAPLEIAPDEDDRLVMREDPAAAFAVEEEAAEEWAAMERSRSEDLRGAPLETQVSHGRECDEETDVGVLMRDHRLECSTVVYAPGYVLTAAHCLYDGTTARALSTYWYTADGRESGRRPFTAAACHAGFTQTRNAQGEYVPTAHDIALLRVPESSGETDLATFPTNTRVLIGGWGLSLPTASGPPGHRTCGFVRSGATSGDRPRTGPEEPGGSGPMVNACQGDSGGGVFLLDRSQSGRRQLVGIISTADSQCDLYGKVTAVGRYRAWIAQARAALERGEGTERCTPVPAP